MYQITYLDAMTGRVLQVKGESLDEAVSAIQKAKDALYYQGSSQDELTNNPPEKLYEAKHEYFVGQDAYVEPSYDHD